MPSRLTRSVRHNLWKCTSVVDESRYDKKLSKDMHVYGRPPGPRFVKGVKSENISLCFILFGVGAVSVIKASICSHSSDQIGFDDS